MLHVVKIPNDSHILMWNKNMVTSCCVSSFWFESMQVDWVNYSTTKRGSRIHMDYKVYW